MPPEISLRRVQYEVDFIATNGNEKYYIQSAYEMSNDEKREQEINSPSNPRISPHPSRHGIAHILCIVLEEVELHGFGDAQQQGAVDRGLTEDFIDVVAGAGNLPGQPAHAALVAFQLRLDEVPDVDVSRICLVCLHKKTANFLFKIEAREKPITTNKKAHGERPWTFCHPVW